MAKPKWLECTRGLSSDRQSSPVDHSSVFPGHDINCTSRTYLPTSMLLIHRTTPLGQQTKHHDGPRRLLAMAHTLLCKSVDGAGATEVKGVDGRPPSPLLTEVCEPPHEKEVSGKGEKEFGIWSFIAHMKSQKFELTRECESTVGLSKRCLF
jgi:hypothetical protein